MYYKEEYYEPPKRCGRVSYTPVYWTDSRGCRWDLREMDTGHIQNCIIILEDRRDKSMKYHIGVYEINNKYAYEWISLFKDELKRRNVIK